MLDPKKDTDLTINFQALFDYPSYLKISHWKEGVDWALFVEKEPPQPREYLKEAALPLAYIATLPGCQKWYQSIPEDVREQLKRYPDMEFTLLYHVSHYQTAYELFLSSPTLLGLLLSYAKAVNWTEDYVVQLLKGKRTDILAACELPGTKSAVKMLGNLDFEKYCIEQFCKIQEGLGLPEYAKLNHHKFVGFDLFSELIRFPYLIGTPLMLDFCRFSWIGSYEMELRDIQLVAMRLDQEASVKARIKKCNNRQEVKNLHDRLVEALNKKEIKGLPNNNFLAPPLEGTETIIPITGSQDLAREGQEQHHCVRGYEGMIKDGNYYVYKILLPERATLGLRLHKNGPPTIDQLLLSCNENVSRKTRKQVKKWLREAIALRGKSA